MERTNRTMDNVPGSRPALPTQQTWPLSELRPPTLYIKTPRRTSLQTGRVSILKFRVRRSHAPRFTRSPDLFDRASFRRTFISFSNLFYLFSFYLSVYFSIKNHYTSIIRYSFDTSDFSSERKLFTRVPSMIH